MNVKEISKRLYALNDALLDKTGKKGAYGGLDLEIKDDLCSVAIYTEYSSKGGWNHGTGKGDTPEAALDAADAIVAALPDLNKARLQAHLERVADCVDQARADNIADEYVTPLTATVAAISANLLAAPVVEATT
jgi:hypothetical protein